MKVGFASESIFIESGQRIPDPSLQSQKEIVINEPNIIDLIKRRIAKITLQIKSVHIANIRKLFGLSILPV